MSKAGRGASKETKQKIGQMYSGRVPGFAPSFWEGWDEHTSPLEIFAEAWDQFRAFGYRDLRALEDRLTGRAEEARKALAEIQARRRVSDDNPAGSPRVKTDDPPGYRQMNLAESLDEAFKHYEEEAPLLRAKTYFWHRALAAGALARYIEEKGTPDEWDELSEPDKAAASGQIDTSNQGGRPPLWTDSELQDLIDEVEAEHKDETLSDYRVAQILVDEKGVDYSERRARDRVKALRKEGK
jgi:hypothetical protein